MNRALVCALLAAAAAVPASAQVVRVATGRLEGVALPSGVVAFKGIPFAAPPVGELRWRPPRPAAPWKGVRRADRFGPRCMQKPVYSDMVFRSDGMGEDCLYLNVWTPATGGQQRLPVLVYFYGGGFIAGDGSEPRYDGESMARRGLVAVTMSYRLGVFGFFAHPELSAESGRGASGNYGLLDQVRALAWVRENIAAFGGDPGRVTIAGESAGSISVSAHLVSPLSKGLFAGAIGESGAVFGTLTPPPLHQAEAEGARFAAGAGARSLAALRAMPAAELLDAAAAKGSPRFRPTLDGYFLPRDPLAVYAAGEQADVPLLVGWNSLEASHQFLLGPRPPTPDTVAAAIRELYGEHAAEVLAVYPAATPEQAVASATDLAGDRFIAYGTWKWAELHRRHGDAPVYRYLFTRPRPPAPEEAPGGPGAGAPPAPLVTGAVHSAEIEYALGNLATNTVHAWTDDDRRVSEAMQGYFAAFVAGGDPNRPGLPAWPPADGGRAEGGEGGRERGAAMVLRIDVEPRAEVERHRERYLLLDRLNGTAEPDADRPVADGPPPDEPGGRRDR